MLWTIYNNRTINTNHKNKRRGASAGKGEYIWSPETGNRNVEIKKYGKCHYLTFDTVQITSLNMWRKAFSIRQIICNPESVWIFVMFIAAEWFCVFKVRFPHFIHVDYYATPQIILLKSSRLVHRNCITWMDINLVLRVQFCSHWSLWKFYPQVQVLPCQRVTRVQRIG